MIFFLPEETQAETKYVKFKVTQDTMYENVAIVSCVTLNFTYCVSTCVSSGKNH